MAREAPAAPRLWRHADFLRLWSGQTISAFGSMVGGTAMSFTALLVLRATPFQMALLQAMQLAPAFLAGLCNRRFSATQYALLSSVMGVPRVIFGSQTGWLAELLGFPWFFVMCAVLAAPGLMMLARIEWREG